MAELLHHKNKAAFTLKDYASLSSVMRDQLSIAHEVYENVQHYLRMKRLLCIHKVH